MIIVFLTLIIIASVVLGLIILIQNPKGGGLASSLGGFGNQLMGVKQTTDVLEKGTWLFAAIIGVLCLTSAMFIPKTGGGVNDNLMNAPASNPSQTPANTAPFNNAQPIQPPANNSK
jgi:preprotein translocase subunit SecG